MAAVVEKPIQELTQPEKERLLDARCGVRCLAHKDKTRGKSQAHGGGQSSQSLHHVLASSIRTIRFH